MAEQTDHRPVWGANLRAAREAAGMTLADVGTELDVTYQAVQEWEAGRTAPTAPNQAALCALFNRTRDELFPLGEVA